MKTQFIYKYYRGSFTYGTFIEGKSDMDIGGIFICNNDSLMGMRDNYEEQISDDKHDITFYEIGRYIELLCKGNPSILEGLFIPDNCVIYKHPVMDILLQNRDRFLTKTAVRSILYYSESQIKKARGLNKKIVNPIIERKTPIDFCYTFAYNDRYFGSKPITQWLLENRLNQKYIGLAHVPNTNGIYAAYYDYVQHIKNEWKTADDFAEKVSKIVGSSKWNEIIPAHITKYLKSRYNFDPFDECSSKIRLEEQIISIYNKLKPCGYHGIQKEDGSSNDIHMDSIEKEDNVLCYISYNENGYQTHCRQYREYQDWVKRRNPVRYSENIDKNYDAKNMMHCVRLLTMAIEIANGEGMKVYREMDREFLLDIRNRKVDYDYILEYAEKGKRELEDLLKTSKLPEDVDKEFANKLLIEIRNRFYSKPDVD